MTKSPKPGFRARAIAELKRTAVVFLYLALFLGSFTAYRRLVLAEYQISSFDYGYAVIEAAVLAKVIVIGSMIGLGERFRERPLVVPVLYKALCFSLFLLAFAILEHAVAGWVHGKSAAVALRELADQGKSEILARVLVKLLALLPLFAVWEMGRVMGEGWLYRLFFRDRPHAAAGRARHD